ncbi:hypothetical protein [Flavobacterium branchiicola]|uniref:Cell wall anchor protein n=1 Tax=Flavobacterium branchiicola TaxID=1114875 RepID=A0ABV9PBU3_9FLAO|nr:hypothetical protein [Flavobacterium branchiicola]MBS7253778.1 hypothetical protein [Flavobacterium branchiicola]
MKNIITSTIFLFINSVVFAQQIGNGYAPIITDLNVSLTSGVYSGLNLTGGATPDSYGWQHVLAIRQGNPANDCQLQITSSFLGNDRLFFRKFGVVNQSVNTPWFELATRGTNTFTGNQTVNGKVGIGTIDPKNALDVNGTVRSKEVKVELQNWSDFVFKKEYNLPTLEQVEKHIAEKGHLENIPSEEEVLKNGISLGEMNAKLLQKIEELTLYVIDQNKSIQGLIEENKSQNKEIKNLKEKIASK